MERRAALPPVNAALNGILKKRVDYFEKLRATRKNLTFGALNP